MPTYTIRVKCRAFYRPTIQALNSFMEERTLSYNDLRKGRWSEPGREYLVTTVTAGRRCVFRDFHCARIFVRELAKLQTEGSCTWLAWVLMPDHFHGMFRLEEGPDMSTVMRYLKGRSARQIGKHLDAPGRMWQPGFHDRALRKEEQRIAIARYIIANPLRAGLVRRIADYPHWDFLWI